MTNSPASPRGARHDVLPCKPHGQLHPFSHAVRDITPCPLSRMANYPRSPPRSARHYVLPFKPRGQLQPVFHPRSENSPFLANHPAISIILQEASRFILFGYNTYQAFQKAIKCLMKIETSLASKMSEIAVYLATNAHFPGPEWKTREIWPAPSRPWAKRPSFSIRKRRKPPEALALGTPRPSLGAAGRHLFLWTPSGHPTPLSGSPQSPMGARIFHHFLILQQTEQPLYGAAPQASFSLAAPLLGRSAAGSPLCEAAPLPGRSATELVRRGVAPPRGLPSAGLLHCEVAPLPSCSVAGLLRCYPRRYVCRYRSRVPPYAANTMEQMLSRMAPNTSVNSIMGHTNLNQWDIFMSSICRVAMIKPVGAM